MKEEDQRIVWHPSFHWNKGYYTGLQQNVAKRIMKFTEIITELNTHGQERVAERLQALNGFQQEKLASQVSKIDWSVVESIATKESETGEKSVEPLAAVEQKILKLIRTSTAKLVLMQLRLGKQPQYYLPVDREPDLDQISRREP